MKPDTTHLEALISELTAIRVSAFWLEGEFADRIAQVVPASRDSARNLLHYMALRRRDIRPLQLELTRLGVSSLGNAEAHVLGTIEQVLWVLNGLLGRTFDSSRDGTFPVRHIDGKARLSERTDALFGPAPPSDGSRTEHERIMVTMPTSASTDYELVRDLVAHGMSCMRINCAHDTTEEWAQMVEHLKRAREETSRDCRLLMDLGGPKLRTGEIEPGPSVIRWEPKRDALGKIVRPASIWLTPLEAPENPPPGVSAKIPVESRILSKLRPGDRISFRDLRGRPRTMSVRGTHGLSRIAQSAQITYLGADSLLRVRPRRKGTADPLLPHEFQPSGIPPLAQHFNLRAGDTLRLTRDQRPARSVFRNSDGQLAEVPRIACTLPEAFAHVRPGDRVVFDDGKIWGVALDASPDEIRVEVTQPVHGTKKLRADKGINFPDTNLGLPALTPRDLEDLDFVVQHADMIGLSFVNRAEDVEELQRVVASKTSRKIGVVLKIETRRAFDQLPRILLSAMRSEPVGVMIARGDLAVECGYERLAEVQEEILWICEAAHVPVIWATQVLDRLNKKGIPSRAEISDAAMGERAECVMLNKGPHVVETVKVLQDILGRMRGHLDKKSPRLRPLRISSIPDPDESGV